GRGDVSKQFRDGKDEVEGGAVLAKFAVDAGFDVEAGFGIEFVADQRADGAEGVKALGAGPLAVFLLEVAGSHVVGQRVAADESSPGCIRGEPGSATANDQGQLAFKVHAGRSCGHADNAAGLQQG